MTLCHQFTREDSKLNIMPYNKCIHWDIKVQNKLPRHTIRVGLSLKMLPIPSWTFLPGPSYKSYGPNHTDAISNLLGIVLLYSGCLKVPFDADKIGTLFCFQ